MKVVMSKMERTLERQLSVTKFGFSFITLAIFQSLWQKQLRVYLVFGKIFNLHWPCLYCLATFHRCNRPNIEKTVYLSIYLVTRSAPNMRLKICRVNCDVKNSPLIRKNWDKIFDSISWHLSSRQLALIPSRGCLTNEWIWLCL